MRNGGKRPRAGRPKGSENKITEEARAKAETMGVKPLDVMLDMIKSELCGENPDRAFLLEICKAAAPYVHAKMHDNKVSANLSIVHVPHVTKL
jgi:hypothetical protein